MNSPIWVHNCVFVITIIRGEFAILIPPNLWFGVCHRCYFLLIYNDSVIISCFILNCHITYLFSQISNLFICGIFEQTSFAADKSIHNLWFSIINNKYSKQVSVITPINHWKMRLYQGSADNCEGDCDSGLNSLASLILGNKLL